MVSILARRINLPLSELHDKYSVNWLFKYYYPIFPPSVWARYFDMERAKSVGTTSTTEISYRKRPNGEMEPVRVHSSGYIPAEIVHKDEDVVDLKVRLTIAESEIHQLQVDARHHQAETERHFAYLTRIEEALRTIVERGKKRKEERKGLSELGKSSSSLLSTEPSLTPHLSDDSPALTITKLGSDI